MLFNHYKLFLRPKALREAQLRVLGDFFSPVAAHLRISEVVVGYPDIFASSIMKTAYFNILLI